MKMKSRNVWLYLTVVFLVFLVYACIHDPFIDPAALNEGNPSTPGCTQTDEVCFESNVLPIFISSCARPGCHDAASREEGYDLSTYTSIVRKGIKPGNASESKIYQVLFKTGEDQMPPDSPLTQAQKDSIKLWIDQGARNTVNCSCYCDTAAFDYAADIEPIINNACVGCHKPGALNGNINLVGYANVKVQADYGSLVGSISHAANYVPMPPGAKLPECEIAKIQNWVMAGSPNN